MAPTIYKVSNGEKTDKVVKAPLVELLTSSINPCMVYFPISSSARLPGSFKRLYKNRIIGALNFADLEKMYEGLTEIFDGGLKGIRYRAINSKNPSIEVYKKMYKRIIQGRGKLRSTIKLLNSPKTLKFYYQGNLKDVFKEFRHAGYRICV